MSLKSVCGIFLLIFLCSCTKSTTNEDRGGLVNAGLPTLVPTAAAVVEPTLTNTPKPQPTAAPTEEQVTDTPHPTNTPVPSTNTSEPPTNTPAPDMPLGDFASVINIVDGDTIEVQVDGTQHTVRYIGIDTPERGEPFADECTAANAALVAGKTVILVKDQSETDRYDRLLRYVFLEDGTFVNDELVRSGYAEAVSYPPDTLYDSQFSAAEISARLSNLGMWGLVTDTPVPPTSTPIQPTQPPLPTPTTAPPPTWTPAPLPTNTPAPEPTQPPPPAPANVQITYIFYDGVVPRVESDEYAEIGNLGAQVVNLGGWRLNADDAGQDFWFPGFDLQPGQRCRVYTNEIHPETCGFSYGNGQALWNNDGECGHLYDASGAEVSTYCY